MKKRKQLRNKSAGKRQPGSGSNVAMAKRRIVILMYVCQCGQWLAHQWAASNGVFNQLANEGEMAAQ
jgi:hypothetical protein